MLSNDSFFYRNIISFKCQHINTLVVDILFLFTVVIYRKRVNSSIYSLIFEFVPVSFAKPYSLKIRHFGLKVYVLCNVQI